MTTQETTPLGRRNPPPVLRDEEPLLRLLVAEATRRGDTLAMLAKSLGVSYERLAQWRRHDAAISRAHRGVHEKAAVYLGVPTVLVLVLTGSIGLQEFAWPGDGAMNDRVNRELERLRQNPFLGGFVPSELESAAPAIRLFVSFLFHELDGDMGHCKTTYRWLSALQQAAAGSVQGQLEMKALRRQSSEGNSLF